MGEDLKQQENKCSTKNTCSIILKVIVGLVFLLLGILALIKWWSALITVVSGCVGLFLILAGVITLAIAKE